MSIKGFNIDGNIEKIDYEGLENKPTHKTINGESILGEGDLSTEEEWVKLLGVSTEAETAYIDIVAPEGKKIKKIHIYIGTGSVGLSQAAKIQINGSGDGIFNNSNGQKLTITSGDINTYAYPVFIIEKGEFFPIVFSCLGSVNGANSSPVHMGGVAQTRDAGNIGAWKAIRVQPVNATFNKGVGVSAWGVYEDENND